MIAKALVRQIFGKATQDRLKVRYWDGSEEEFGKGKLIGTMHIKHAKVLAELAKEPELGFAEAYMHGDITFDGSMHDLVLFAAHNHITTPSKSSGMFNWFVRGFSKATSVTEQRQDIGHHYDLGNDLYRLFLDDTMTYSCAYFRTQKDSLEKAQRQKVSHVLRKLNLKKGERLLDIGSGWGQLILQAATEYGVTAHGITMSQEQLEETTRRIKEAKLTGKVTVSLEDYRTHAAAGHTYDKIASVGMFEHVGRPNLAVFMDAIKQMLEPGGLMLLHFITKLMEGQGGQFTTKYIFPGGYIPSVRETIALLPEYDFRLLDAENLRIHYAMTLDVWAKNFEDNLDEVRALLADTGRLDKRWDGVIDAEKFIRMWRLYLQGASANFRSGGLELHQFLIGNGANNELPLTREAWYR